MPIPPAFLLDPAERERGCGLLRPPSAPAPLSPKVAVSSVVGGGNGESVGGSGVWEGMVAEPTFGAFFRYMLLTRVRKTHKHDQLGINRAPSSSIPLNPSPTNTQTQGLLPLGLYRLCPSTSQHYVVTAPPAALLLEPSDHAFVLTPGGGLLPQQEAQLQEDERDRQAAERACAAHQQRQHGQRLGPGADASGSSSSPASGAARLQALFLNLPNGA